MQDSQVSVNEEVVETAYQLCWEFLGGAWKQLTKEKFHIEEVNGGLSNALYLCSLPVNTPVVYREPRQVLLRIFGDVLEDDREAKMHENVIFTILSERKLGPKLYGVFSRGRLEEHIPSRCLRTEELQVADYSASIARKLARLHHLHVPICKTPKWIFNMTNRWLHHIRESRVLTAREASGTEPVLNKLLSYDFESELQYMTQTLQHSSSPVVFCHNDAQEGNILLRDKKGEVDDRLIFIDFEYCAYNYQAFDMANHFCEWMYDYKVDDPPFYKVHEDYFPSKDQQLHFIRSYRAEADLISSRHKHANQVVTMNALQDEQSMLWEVKKFCLASHMIWCLWSIVQAELSKIEFDYLGYSHRRLDAYLKVKQEVVAEEP